MYTRVTLNYCLIRGRKSADEGTEKYLTTFQDK